MTVRIEARLPHLSSQAIDVSERAERLGFDGLVSYETSHDPFLPLAVAAEHTQHAKLRTGLAIAFPRSPHVVANVCWDLQGYSKGRFILGLGPQVKGHNERRFGVPWPSPPAPRLREYVLAVKAFLRCWGNQEPLNFVGQYYSHTLMTFNFTPEHHEYWDTPIYISALGPAMARVAGEVCEGVMIHPMCSYKYVCDVTIPALEEGCRKAGRKLTDLEILGGDSFSVTGDTEEELELAMRRVARQISFYGSTRTYQRALEVHGYKQLNLQLHELSLRGEWEKMHALVTNDVVRDLCTVGTREEVARIQHERWKGFNYATTLEMPAEGDVRGEERLKGLMGIHRGTNADPMARAPAR